MRKKGKEYKSLYLKDFLLKSTCRKCYFESKANSHWWSFFIFLTITPSHEWLLAGIYSSQKIQFYCLGTSLLIKNKDLLGKTIVTQAKSQAFVESLALKRQR